MTEHEIALAKADAIAKGAKPNKRGEINLKSTRLRVVSAFDPNNSRHFRTRHWKKADRFARNYMGPNAASLRVDSVQVMV